MAIYDWPTTRTFLPQTAELRVVDNSQRTLESPLSGYVQTLSMPGARWGWGFDFGAHADAERDALEAYLLRLSGREHRVRLWDLKKPRPRGSINTGGVTLAASAGQFATTLQLAGCVHPRNALLGANFHLDSNDDGLADEWNVYAVGTIGAVTCDLFAPGIAIGNTQRVSASALGTEESAIGISSNLRLCTHLAGQPICLSAYIAGSVGAQGTVWVDWFDGANAYITTTHNSQTLTAGIVRVISTGVAPSNAVSCRVYAWMRAVPTAGPANVRIDAVQLEPGNVATDYAGPASLAAGDWLSLANGQLVRVVADATADDIGRMTVEVRHMLRSAVASGSAVTLDRPTALFVRTEAGLALPRMPGLAAPGMSAEFVEVFA